MNLPLLFCLLVRISLRIPWGLATRRSISLSWRQPLLIKKAPHQHPCSSLLCLGQHLERGLEE